VDADVVQEVVDVEAMRNHHPVVQVDPKAPMKKIARLVATLPKKEAKAQVIAGVVDLKVKI
jgi:hypothetical protein